MQIGLKQNNNVDEMCVNFEKEERNKCLKILHLLKENRKSKKSYLYKNKISCR